MPVAPVNVLRASARESNQPKSYQTQLIHYDALILCSFPNIAMSLVEFSRKTVEERSHLPHV